MQGQILAFNTQRLLDLLAPFLREDYGFSPGQKYYAHSFSFKIYINEMAKLNNRLRLLYAGGEVPEVKGLRHVSIFLGSIQFGLLTDLMRNKSLAAHCYCTKFRSLSHVNSSSN
jgi:hypothetical protein